MSAQHIFDHAPLGALVRFSDGSARPQARFTRKLSAWENNNGVGRLTRKIPPIRHASYAAPASFALHIGDFESGGAAAVTMARTFDVNSALQFQIAELPRAGMVRVLSRFNDTDHLIYLAADMASAEAWLQAHHHASAVFDLVT